MATAANPKCMGCSGEYIGALYVILSFFQKYKQHENFYLDAFGHVQSVLRYAAATLGSTHIDFFKGHLNLNQPHR